jgi:hypothetical protein
MGLLKTVGARKWRKYPRPPRVGFNLSPRHRRYRIAQFRRQIDAWRESDLPLLVLAAPPQGARVLYNATLDTRDGVTLSQRRSTTVTEELATTLSIRVLRVADGDYDGLVNSRVAKHIKTAHLQAAAAARGAFADRTPRLPPDPQPWIATSIFIDGTTHTGRRRSLSTAEWLAYTQHEGALVELHARAVDPAAARLRTEQPSSKQLARHKGW